MELLNACNAYGGHEIYRKHFGFGQLLFSENLNCEQFHKAGLHYPMVNIYINK